MKRVGTPKACGQLVAYMGILQLLRIGISKPSRQLTYMATMATAAPNFKELQSFTA